jgi:hypothetical protein
MTTLTRSLIDQGRRIRAVEVGERLDGEADESVTIGPWFDCLLLGAASTEVTADAAERERDEARLLFGPDEVLLGADQIEVDSPVHGRAVWQLVGDAQPIRRRQHAEGFEARLRRVS